MKKPVQVDLVEYKLFSFHIKVLHPLKIKPNPIKNFIISLISISNRKQKHLDKRCFCCNFLNFLKIILLKERIAFLKDFINKINKNY